MSSERSCNPAGAEPVEGTMPREGLRHGLMALGWLCVAAGTVGIFLPLLPTTPFLLVALWCFSRSSRRFHDWLYRHPRLGPPLREWREHRVIPLRAKITAVVVMAASWTYVTVYVAEGWILPSVVAAVLLPLAIFVVTRPSKRPTAALTR